MGTNAFQHYLESLHTEFAGLDTGAVASYIPELTKADPAWFGIALVTVDGHVYQVGDSRQPFTIQSISKAITYGLALEDSGVDAVLRKVDVEPSGEAFNSISLEPGTGRPRNPMINAGAIATVALIEGETPEAKFARMLACYERYLGHRIALDDDVYRSEKATGHRNRAIAYLLHNSNIIERDTDDVLDVYFRQCSLLVTCRDLAVIGATLANDGVNPITAVRALRSAYVPKVLSVMMSCGMYDFSGAWTYEIGMPAKSGVGGGIIAVLPGQFGLAVFSPPLDDRGNSARGIAVCRRFSSDYHLHTFHTSRSSVASVVHATYDAAQLSSKRARAPAQLAALAERGRAAAVLELQGELNFAAAEIVLREALRVATDRPFLVLDFARVGVIDDGALTLLCDLVESLYSGGCAVLVTGVTGKYMVGRALRTRMHGADTLPLLACEDVDHALEWCEARLLEGSACVGQEAPLAEQAFVQGFSAAELAALEALLERQRFGAGTVLCREGDPADTLFFILAGEVRVSVPLALHRQGRITTVGAGSAVGEMAMLDRGKRSADIVADTDVTCMVLDYHRLAAAGGAAHIESMRLKLVTNVARVLTRKLRQATLEIKLLRD